jgi:hypothetical protein
MNLLGIVVMLREIGKARRLAVGHASSTEAVS